MDNSKDIPDLLKQIADLENENAVLRRDFRSLPQGSSVTVPEPFKPLFDLAQQTVHEYFSHLKMDPTKGTIEINDQRYVLVSASALSCDFLETIQRLYADRGDMEAMSIGKNFLFDVAHVIGMNDAKNFHSKMNLTDPISKLSAGPVHFAYSGWAFVDILPESNPTPDENFYLFYKHPYSFEADSWIRSGKKAHTSVCIMNAGYSSGWCEESFGIPLTAAEVSCTARGDESCTFIMSPPHKIQEHLQRYDNQNKYNKKDEYQIPTFFERKKVEEEMQRSRILAEESSKSKADFIANMSHELRTPLGAIIGFTDLLKKTALSAVQKEYLDAIGSSGNSLLSIINDILDLSKLDSGKFIIESVPFNVFDLLQSVQVMFLPKAKKKKLALTCAVDKEIDSFLSGDPMRLTQVLINLVGNAIKFTEKGSVSINCSLASRKDNVLLLQFSIRDTGIGIPEDKTENIFERFTQADSNITRRYGGTGLGLAITKQLIELQGGSISLKSVEGSGAEFIFNLPYTISDEQPVAVIYKEVPEKVIFGSIKNILVVDDNLFNQKLAVNILQNNDFNVTVAENGSQALDILKTGSFDVILMDIQMPVMDGYRATQLIREEMHITTPVIAMTAHALAGEREKCLEVGMNDYLSKPFKEIDLLNKIARWNKDAGMTKAAENKIIDLSFLLSQTRDNRPFIIEMITLFKQQNPKEIAKLQEAIAVTDYAEIYRVTHTIRNTTGFFGIDHLIGNELVTIEKLARAGAGIEEINQLYAKVEAVCKKAVAELEVIDTALQL